MPNVTGHTELVGLMAYPIRHTQSPTTHNLAYDKNGDDVIQLAFEVDNDSLKDAVQSIRALKMLGSNISMPNKTVVHKYLDEVDEAAKLCGAINTVVNLRDENGQVTGKLKGYNTDGMGYWQALTEEGIDFKGMKMVLIGTGGAATAIAVRGALDGVAEIEIFNIKDKFYSRGEEIVDLINKNTNCKATMNDLADKDLLKEKMHAADLFCDATGVGMHPLEDLSNIPDPSFFKKDLIVTDTVYAPRETVMIAAVLRARTIMVHLVLRIGPYGMVDVTEKARTSLVHSVTRTQAPSYLAALPRRSEHPRLGAPAPRPHARLAPRALLLLLAAERGSEQGRRWAAPVVLRSLAARSASASGWAAGVGHAGLNSPREERRAPALLPLSERSPTSRRSAALFSSPALGGLRCPARAKTRNAVAAEPLARGCATRTCPPL